MGNACAKNAPDQVKENKPAAPKTKAGNIDTSALDEREKLNERLQQQKRELEAELARWRAMHGDRMKNVEQELAEVQKEAASILSAGGTTLEMKQCATELLRPELEVAEKEEVEQLKAKRNKLKEYLNLISKENAAFDDITQKAEQGAQDLDRLLDELKLDQDETSFGQAEDTEAFRRRTLGIIASLYRPIPQPHTLEECIDQTRIDCAECSSQTVRNLKALAHHWQTGDDSWYLTRPIRGVLCNSLRLGNIPHDPWNCEICHYVDVSDAPIFV